MKTITAYKCQHCGKIYEKNQSCKSHESKCYFNPKTFSCASCAFKIFGEYKMPNDHFTNVRTCMLNFDITSRLKTKCSQHISSSHPEVRKYIQKLDFDISHCSLPPVVGFFMIWQISSSKA